MSEAELEVLFDRALERALHGLEFDQQARERLIGFADGDARRLLNLLELIQTAAGDSEHDIGGAFVDHALARNLRRFDKGGDAF